MSEQILVFPADNIKEFDFSHKVILVNNPSFDSLIKKTALADNLFFTDRKSAEENPEIKQLIPYCVLVRDGKVFCYRRTSKGGENRLHAKWSCGVGGHCNPVDEKSSDKFRACLERELAEEVGLNDPSKFFTNLVGVIYDGRPSDEPGKIAVGQVHVGFIFIVHLTKEAEIFCLDNALSNGDFETIEVLVRNREMFETWSQIVIDEIPLLKELGLF
jgi:predicted NUDIX family phosphoesterase